MDEENKKALLYCRLNGPVREGATAMPAVAATTWQSLGE